MQFKNIYKTPTKKLKKSIDFDEKVCYYISKERENPKSSREVGTGFFPIFERSSNQWKGKLLSTREHFNIFEVRVAEKESVQWVVKSRRRCYILNRKAGEFRWKLKNLFTKRLRDRPTLTAEVNFKTMICTKVDELSKVQNPSMQGAYTVMKTARLR